MKKVMLVEDEELILQGLTHILDWEGLGMEVIHQAHNGQEALLCWKQEPVDIIITDIQMPVMDGLEFLKELRTLDKRARCILLTGFDEFEYARKAISLDVEDYILKPINEEKLEMAVKQCGLKLQELDKKQAADPDDKAGWMQFLGGSLSPQEMEQFREILPPWEGRDFIYAAILRLHLEGLKSAGFSDILCEIQKETKIRTVYLSTGNLLLLIHRKNEEDCVQDVSKIQQRLESDLGVLSFISISPGFTEFADLPRAYQKAMNLQKYQVIEGYGGCITLNQVEERKTGDLSIDTAFLKKMILQKEQEKAVDYIEDLFINHIRRETALDDFYGSCVQLAMLLQDIKSEYKLFNRKDMKNLTEMIEKVYQAEDLFAVKTLFIGEIAEIISYLHEENSQYTPVVKQILSEVHKNYKEDMNLKTLSYKYNMNASYLGQIFQKEVGCSFAQYLSNTKNGIAKDLILNTNMRIHDIAREVGYVDTSYFYRKFKQCFGVSPASLREMKRY